MRVLTLRVRRETASAGSLQLPAGRPCAVNLNPVGNPPQRRRRLNSAQVSRRFQRPVPIERDFTIEVIDDISGSMTGGNDATGLRHEAILIFLEHLVRTAKSRRGRAAKWYFRSRTFDNGGSCLDIERTPLDPSRLPSLRTALLGKTYGGSSNLGPVLSASIADAHVTAGTLLRIVTSDFELFDPSVPQVLAHFATAKADLNVAIVFRSQPPTELEDSDVRVHHVDPTTARPELVAELIHDAVHDTLTKVTFSEAASARRGHGRTAMPDQAHRDVRCGDG